MTAGPVRTSSTFRLSTIPSSRRRSCWHSMVYAQDAGEMVQFCGLSEKADKEGFIVVYPNGTGRMERMLTWNAGTCCGCGPRNVDDVGFVDPCSTTSPNCRRRSESTPPACRTGRCSAIGLRASCRIASPPSLPFLAPWARRPATP